MTVYGITDLAHIWTRNGGAANHAVAAVSVALAESGGNDHAVSPSADYGLWQINRTNFAAQGLSVASSFDPDTNARVAIRMSGNGTNWAAWCTCWVNPAANCGHGFISLPQPGSPAGSHLTIVSAVLGIVTAAQGITAAVGNEGNDYKAAWSQVGDFFGAYSRRAFTGIHGIRTAIERIRA